MSSTEKELAKIEKKRAKAGIKAIKSSQKETVEAGLKAMKRQGEAGAIIVKEQAPPHKDWRSNLWLYIVVAIVIGLILWGLTNILSKALS